MSKTPNTSKLHTAEISEHLILPGSSDVYWMRLDIKDNGEFAKSARPGQLLGVSATPDLAMRPFTINNASKSGRDSLIDVVYRVVGPGTMALSKFLKNQEINIMGPKGNGFTTNIPKSAHPLIIGGGMGSAMIQFLAKYFNQKDIIYGGAGYPDVRIWQSHLAGTDEGNIYYTTDDGSYGAKGLVTDTMKQLLDAGRKYDMIYTCGPLAMMKAVYDLAKQAGIPCEVALEAKMGCLVGFCKSCTCLDAQGKTKTVCKDGPVFDASELNWEYLKEIEEFKKPKYTQGFKRDLRSINYILRQTFDLNQFLGGKPFMTASGCSGYGETREAYGDEVADIFGAEVSKGTTYKQRNGNRGTRLYENGHMANSIGLENPGIHDAVENEIPEMVKRCAGRSRVVINISGDTAEEFGEMAALVDSVPGIDAIEANFSCPNTEKENNLHAHDKDAVANGMREIRKYTKLPVFAKLSPNIPNMIAVAQAAQSEGASAITASNTLIGAKINPEIARFLTFMGTAGLSGNETILEVTLRHVTLLYPNIKIPIIASGGIESAEDVVNAHLAGAHAVQLGTSLMRNPFYVKRLPELIAAFMAKHHRSQSLDKITGMVYHDNKGKTLTKAKRDFILAPDGR